ERLFGGVPRLHHLVRRAGGRDVHFRRQHDVAEKNVRQHHERDRTDGCGSLSDPDRAGLGAAAVRNLAAPAGHHAAGALDNNKKERVGRRWQATFSTRISRPHPIGGRRTSPSPAISSTCRRPRASPSSAAVMPAYPALLNSRKPASSPACSNPP